MFDRQLLKYMYYVYPTVSTYFPEATHMYAKRTNFFNSLFTIALYLSLNNVPVFHKWLLSLSFHEYYFLIQMKAMQSIKE